MKVKRSLYYILTSELLFIILPIIVVLIVRGYEKNFNSIFYNTEWSIMAIILFGQSIVKFSSGVSNSSNKFNWPFVSLIISIIIIFGLIPSIIVLVINLTTLKVGFGIQLIQVILFIVSAFCFYIVGAIGQKLLNDK